jgi:peptide deformylase
VRCFTFFPGDSYNLASLRGCVANFRRNALAARPILVLPDEFLRKRAKRVRVINAPMQRLIDDMIDTMRKAHGVGLAAIQIGVLQRVAVIEIPEEDVRVLINPEILRRGGEREVTEGCLSIPGYRGKLRRSVKVTARALDRHGKEIRIKAEELLAQALEHEIDHLNGILYIDHLETHSNLWKLEPEAIDTEAATEAHSG